MQVPRLAQDIILDPMGPVDPANFPQMLGFVFEAAMQDFGSQPVGLVRYAYRIV